MELWAGWRLGASPEQRSDPHQVPNKQKSKWRFSVFRSNPLCPGNLCLRDWAGLPGSQPAGTPPGDGLLQDRTAKDSPPILPVESTRGPSPFIGPQTPRPQVAGESPEASLSSHSLPRCMIFAGPRSASLSHCPPSIVIYSIGPHTHIYTHRASRGRNAAQTQYTPNLVQTFLASQSH